MYFALYLFPEGSRHPVKYLLCTSLSKHLKSNLYIDLACHYSVSSSHHLDILRCLRRLFLLDNARAFLISIMGMRPSLLVI